MHTPKAKRLLALSEIVDVPPFTLVKRGEVPLLPGRPSGGTAYLVRSCTFEEDQSPESHAGRFYTSPPLKANEIAAGLKKAFEDEQVAECLVQEFAEDLSGVVFCLSDREALVEYTRRREGVTAGKVTPYCALLPCGIDRYGKLAGGVFKIYAAFGPCDMEFVGLDPPRFVQVRPLTTGFSFARDMTILKMQLQELQEQEWEETEFCIDLAEKPDCDAWYRALFVKVLPRLFRERFNRRIDLPHQPFLKIGKQHFVAASFMNRFRIHPLRNLLFGLRFLPELRQIRKELDGEGEVSPERLMEISILLNLYHALIPDVILVTDELYPEIAGLFGSIKAVISEGGAFTSHLAILAREAGMPLMIQVSGALEKTDRSR